MEHRAHRPGTIAGCTDCHQMAYEPGWYASLVAFELDDVVVQETSDLRVGI